jgi:hypothetical protein
MPTAILIWVWFCAYLNCVGWTLSALHQLNAAGYAVALLLGVVAFVAWRKQTAGRIFPQISRRKLKRRFCRPFPLAFLILAAMVFLGGALYAPANYDALAYRIPRVLHWLAAGQWHWIHTIFPRINTRSCGIEWVSAPVIALLGTDRWLFLINFISFLLLPGLVFSLFTRLGVRRRVAWHWMWIVPTGYGFLLQAGSMGNDLFGATLALAAVDLALRANRSKLPRDFFASLLAAAMMTSAKMNNLPLLLPWAVAILPALDDAPPDVDGSGRRRLGAAGFSAAHHGFELQILRRLVRSGAGSRRIQKRPGISGGGKYRVAGHGKFCAAGFPAGRPMESIRGPEDAGGAGQAAATNHPVARQQIATAGNANGGKRGTRFWRLRSAAGQHCGRDVHGAKPSGCHQANGP